MGTHPIFESDFDCLTEMTSSAARPFQKGEKIFRLASGISLNGDDSRFSTLEAPTDWNDNILSELFSKCISSDKEVSNSLVELPPTQHPSLESSRGAYLGNWSNVPSHDAVYGGWTTVGETPVPENTEAPAEVHGGEVEEKNILLSCTSSEEEYYSTPQKNKSHDLFDVSKDTNEQSKTKKEKSKRGKTTKSVDEKEYTRLGADEIADLCQSWFMAGKNLGIYLTKNDT